MTVTASDRPPPWHECVEGMRSCDPPEAWQQRLERITELASGSTPHGCRRSMTTSETPGGRTNEAHCLQTPARQQPIAVWVHPLRSPLHP